MTEKLILEKLDVMERKGAGLIQTDAKILLGNNDPLKIELKAE